jgi:translocation and assembly module TamA
MPHGSRPWHRPAATLVAVACLVGGCTALPLASDEPARTGTSGGGQSDGAAEAATTNPGVPYQVEFTGVTNSALLDLLRESSTLVLLKDRPPVSTAALDNRIADDRERLDTVLRSRGYYDAGIAVAIDDKTSPETVTLTITPGKPYRLEAYTINFVGNALPPPTVPLVSDLGITYGDVALAKTVVDAQARLLRKLADAQRPLARVVDRKVIVDRDTHAMRVTVNVDAGPPTRFGPTTIAGLHRTHERYVRELLPWRQGEPYTQAMVERGRRRLLRTGLFDAVEIQHREAIDKDGELPMAVTLVEGKPRSISAAAKYSTTEGPGGDVAWEDRNLFGSNEKLVVKAEANRFTQTIGGELTLPNWQRPDRELLFGLSGVHTNSIAFDELGGEVSARMRTPLADDWIGAIGPSLEASQIKDDTGMSSVVLVGLPAMLSRDDTKDKLDPKSGTRLLWQATPYTGYFNKSVTFLENVVTTSGYLPLDADKRFVLAGRLKVGSIVGESRQDIPANKRFYAGGGDSIRGYPYQKVGPLNKDNDPIGGRSLFAFSVETRARVWGNFGAVAFLDGGTVYSSVVPSFDDTMRFAAGPGLRYLTPVGPIRIDVAFPLNRRKDVDNSYEFYISIGQSF